MVLSVLCWIPDLSFMSPPTISAILILCVLALGSAIQTTVLNGSAHGNMRRLSSVSQADAEGGAVFSRNGTHLPPYTTIYHFDQLVDHTNPSLGTFKQRFWHTYEFYEPGKYQVHCCLVRQRSNIVYRWPNNFDDTWRDQCSEYASAQAVF